MAAEIGADVVFLSDPSMRVIYRYGMKGENMPMADMGYVVIDGAGKIRARKIDRLFGEHVQEIVNAVKDVTKPGGA